MMNRTIRSELGAMVAFGACGACALLLTGGCNNRSTTSLELADYKTSCTQHDQCVLVTMGEVCACTCGGGSAINREDKARYDEDYRKARESCDEAIFAVCGACPPQAYETSCIGGTCAAGSLPPDAGTPH